ncbi:GPP34 family phosphoprotein [Nonomuraea sp. K274]|uniref:GPP34 family phosphoprotein n=1 Tax=Nonomuraea cypriaca TaxID=1187855 RepID=A0A931EYD3_9ACTN|nr:GPP34 family phosphoprotein [Nonomuraea cypriaca]MBF8188659.1 GPP34 family phosphoprotein [Nonomuraea cypriaca]
MLADDFFLVSWDTTGSGKPRLHVQGIALGLAGALIGELVLDRRVAVRGVSLEVVDSRPAGDGLANTVLTDIGNSPHHTGVRTWLAYLARRSVADVSARMEATGLLRQEAPKLLRRKQPRYFSTDFVQAMWPTTRLRLALVRREPLASQDMALATLVDACDLTGTVLDDPADLRVARPFLTAVLAAMPPPLSDLSRLVRAAVGDAVLTYRT